MASSDQVTSRAAMKLAPQGNVAVALRALRMGETILIDGTSLRVGATWRRGTSLRPARSLVAP
jgi:hypothetical protein